MTNLTKRRIYIESTVLKRLPRAGVEMLAEGLIGELVRQSPEIEFVFFSFQESAAPLSIKGKNVREVVITRMPLRLFRLLLLLGIAPSVEWLTGEENIQDVIFPNFSAWPIKTKGARIYPYVHDTSYLDTPEYSSSRLQRFLHWTVGRSIKLATRVLVNSESTKRAVIKHYSIPGDRVDVIYPGAPNQMKPVDVDVPKEYILFVGTLEPRKNVANLIRAYGQLPQALRQQYPLLLVGKKGWLDNEIEELISAGAERGVRTLGYVDESTRQALYAGATVFAYPSLYEGFGMPIIEAQMHGVPVITTRSSSLPEAGGDAALYSKPDAKSLADALKMLLQDKALRTKLARLGRQHAAQFTWSRSAQQLQKLLGIK